MKVAPIHRAFQKYENAEHKIAHTGQHYDKNMSDAFFQDLDMPQPAYFMGVGSGSHAQQTAKIMTGFEDILVMDKPDLVIVVGDVNSTLACSITAVKLGIKTAHVEAGLRSFDRVMPEEINRMVTDSISDFCFLTEESAGENLRREGFNMDNAFFVGNTMIDSMLYALDKTKNSTILSDLALIGKDYALMTLHRPSNVDDHDQLGILVDVFEYASKNFKLVFPIHPRTRKNLELFGLDKKVNEMDNLILTNPLGYIDFLALMKKAAFVMTDSGGIQEETTALKVPCITLRTTTERPITTKIGTNRLIFPVKEKIIEAIDMVGKGEVKGEIPPLWDGQAGDRIAGIIINRIFA
jgi:UDP-N-acetylglucosamine 2-epimerase (non-hydrolysing)